VARGTRRGAHAAIPGAFLSIDLPFALETDVERRIADDPEWQEGVEWGRPRRGHPEGSVKQHIADVLANVEREASSPDDRRRLRLAALVHDSFKYRAPEASAPVGSPGHHGTLAAAFLARFVDDPDLVQVVLWHDEAFAAAQQLRRRKKARAEQRIQALVERLGPTLPLYATFFRADNATGDKDQRSVEWFEGLVRKWTE
jgi:HD domain